jgi:1-phosphofructokinase family hexose kinase
MILVAGPSPAFQQRMVFDALSMDAVNRAREVEALPCGKPVNCGRALHRLGVPSRTVIFLGGGMGAWIGRYLDGEGIPYRAVPCGAETRIACTVFESASGRTTELVENARRVTDEEAAAFLAAAREELASAKALLLAGSLPEGFPASIYRDLAAEAVARGLPVVVDAQGAALLAALEARPTVCKPNRAELAAATGLPTRTPEERARAMEELRRRGARAVVVSDGAREVAVLSDEGLELLEPPKVKLRNAIGSGDVLASAVVSRLAEGAPLREAVRWGVACAAANASGPGYARVDPAAARGLLDAWSPARSPRRG